MGGGAICWRLSKITHHKRPGSFERNDDKSSPSPLELRAMAMEDDKSVICESFTLANGGRGDGRKRCNAT